MIQFTQRCEEATKSHNLHNFKGDIEQQLESYTNVDISGGEPGANDSGSQVLELKLKALILDTIHNIEVVEMLIETNVKGMEEWLWQKQLRYGWCWWLSFLSL